MIEDVDVVLVLSDTGPASSLESLALVAVCVDVTLDFLVVDEPIVW